MSKAPDAFRTISEVAEWLETPAHVLRFWESKFSQVKPVKRAGGRRYYRPTDMLLLAGIKRLLHEDGMTIKGVQKILREHGIKHVSGMSPALDAETEDAAAREEPPLVSLATSEEVKPDTGTVLPFQGKTEREEVPTAVAEDAPAEEPQAASEPEQATEPDAETTPAVEDEHLPAFIRRSVAPSAADTSDSPAEPEPEALAPRDITVPEDAQDTDPAASGLLSDIAKGGPLASGSLGEIASLLDRLDAWRSDLAVHRNE